MKLSLYYYCYWILLLLWISPPYGIVRSSAFSPSLRHNGRARCGVFGLASTTLSRRAASLQEEQQVTTLDDNEPATTSTILANDEDFIKPLPDKRHYRAILLPNGLRVLLVSSPRSDTEAGALHVQAGHFDDGTRPGLAHFHEHMLFLGTHKYPLPDEFETFLASNGGSSNAYTDMEDTNYYFSVTPLNDDDDNDDDDDDSSVVSDALLGALDRFAQFFILPNFNETMVEKELRAIDSEYRNSITSDAWRNYQLLKSASHDDHPFHKFGCGNYKTLSKGETSPRDELLEFCRKYYQTYNMRLCVVGRASLDSLQQAVESTFGNLRHSDPSQSRRGNKLSPPLTEFPTEHAQYKTSAGKIAKAFDASNLGIVRETVPLIESRSLKVHFAAPPLDDALLKQSRPYRVLSHILGHESPGSLHALLNNKGWLVGLSSGIGIDCSDFSFFTLTLSLTPDGMKHVDDVLDLIFEWIALLRETSDERFQQFHQELCQISNTNFLFRENGDSTDFCSSAAELMFDYEPSKLLQGPTYTGDYDGDVLQAFMKRMTPENALVVICNSDLTVEGDEWKTEPWYKAQYRDVKMTKEQIKKWSNPPEIDPQLFLPALNAYIPTDFTLKCDVQSESVNEEATAVSLSREEDDDDDEADIALELQPPKLLSLDDSTSSNLRMWHKMDQYWKVPKTYIRLSLLTPNVYHSPRSMTLCRIYQRVLNDDLNSLVYDASVAGCNYRVACIPTGFRISVKGYSEKLPFLLKTLTTRMLTILDELKKGDNPALQRKFDKACANLLRETKNYRLDSPYEVASYNSRLVMEESVWYVTNYIDEMERGPPLTMKECAQVTEQCLLGRVKAEALVIGNINEKEAQEVAEVVDDVFLRKSQPLLDVETPVFRSMKLPTVEESKAIFGSANALVYQELAFSPSEENNAVELVLQAGCDLELGYEGVAVLELISHMAYNSAYNQLRTVEQLGYLVSSFARKSTGGSWALSTVVQSSVAAPEQLEERMEAWLQQFYTELQEMDPQDIATEAGAVVAQLLERDTRLSQEVGRAWSEIMATESLSDSLSKNPPFDRVERIAEQLMVVDEREQHVDASTNGSDEGTVCDGDSLNGVSPRSSGRQTAAELKQKVLDLFQHYFAKDSPHRRTISSRVYSQKFEQQYNESVNKPGVLSKYDDIFHLKQYLSTFPTAPYWAANDDNDDDDDDDNSKTETTSSSSSGAAVR